MRRGLDTLLFNLLVLGSLCDKMGRVWRRRSTDLYVIEITTAAPLPTGLSREEEAESQEVSKGHARFTLRALKILSVFESKTKVLDRYKGALPSIVIRGCFAVVNQTIISSYSLPGF